MDSVASFCPCAPLSQVFKQHLVLHSFYFTGQPIFLGPISLRMLKQNLTSFLLSGNEPDTSHNLYKDMLIWLETLFW